LGGATLRIPPLRERRDEIHELAHELAASMVPAGSEPPRFAVEALALLGTHDWPGNIRELRNVIERAILMSDGATIEAHHLDHDGGADDDAFAAAHLDERARIVRALERSAGNQTRAARMLRVSRATLVRRLDEYDLPRPKRPGISTIRDGSSGSAASG